MSLLSLATRTVAARMPHAPAARATAMAMRGMSTEAAAAAAVQPALAEATAAAASSAPTAPPAVSIPRLRIGSSANRVSFATPKVRAGQQSAVSSAALVSYPLETAVGLVRACAHATFDETVALSLRLNLDPRKPNQSVRGAAALPHGTGKTVRVAVFAKGEKAQEAQAAGADIVGEKDLVDQILAGKILFERCIATPDMMAFVGRVARILGPRGLMPNPKVGTVTMDVAGAVKAAKQGSVEFKTDKSGVIHAPMGKVSFTKQQLAENVTAFVERMIELKPSGAPKGVYIMSAHVSSSQGSGVPIDTRLAPFKSATQQAASDEAGRVASGAFGRMHSVHGFDVVRYDLGAHPAPEVAQEARGKWPQVKEQIKRSRKEGHSWSEVMDKVDAINKAPRVAPPAAAAAAAATPKGPKGNTPVPSTHGKEVPAAQK